MSANIFKTAVAVMLTGENTFHEEFYLLIPLENFLLILQTNNSISCSYNKFLCSATEVKAHHIYKENLT